MQEKIQHWSENKLWTGALERFYEQRDSGARAFNIDVAAVERLIFSSETPAYELMEAMVSVKVLEGWDGYRGAPRLILALLQLLHEQAPLD